MERIFEMLFNAENLRVAVLLLGMIWGFIWLRGNFREEMRTEIGAVRAEIGSVWAEIGAVRAEIGAVRGEIIALDKKLSAEIGSVRCEIAALDKKLSIEIIALDKKLSGEIVALDKKLSGEIVALDRKLSGEIAALDRKLSGEIAVVRDEVRGLKTNDIAHLQTAIEALNTATEALTFTLTKNGTLSDTDKEYIDGRIKAVSAAA